MITHHGTNVFATPDHKDTTLASASVTPSSVADDLADATTPHVRDRRRRQTTHLKHVPDTKPLREQIRQRCVDVAARLDKSHPLSKDAVETIARATLTEMGLPEGYLGWTMVMLASAFWRDQVAAVPPSRRLFLLPHCLKHTEHCNAHYDEFGLDCRSCGACNIGDFRTMAQELGYRVLVAEGSPIVMKIILSGYVDAIVGVACLNVLEKAIDKVLLAGIPCMAVPLLSSKCKATSVDEDWVRDMIQLQHSTTSSATRTYVHIMRAASGMFEQDMLDRCAPRLRGGPRLSELNGQGIAGDRTDCRHRSHCLRLPGQRRQVLTTVHHAGRARRHDRRPGNRAGRCRACRSAAGWPSSEPPCRSRPFTRPRSCTTTSKTTMPFATATRPCIAGTAWRPPSMSAIT